MEERRFDELTRTLGRATSRRGVLKGLLGGLAAVWVGKTSNPAAAHASLQRTANNGSRVESVGGCSVAQCIDDADKTFRQEYQACGANGSPGAALCVVAALFQRRSNEQSCRKSGCFLGYCSNGVCCIDGTVGCNGNCVDLASDPQNCGSCGHACDPGAECSGGQCGCTDNQTNCDGHCIDTQNDHDNCGSCGHACTGCEICATGQCSSICTEDAPCCNDHCVSTQCDPPRVFDPTACECVCPPGNQCGDACCTDGQECCNGQCFDPCLDNAPRDPSTCQCGCGNGTVCGTECCAYSDECCNDQCVTVCPPGQQRDPSTCACVCSAGEVCGPFCCSSDKVCCPDALTGMSCRDPDPVCSGCTYSCGDICCGQYEYCVRCADYSYQCAANSGVTC